MKRLVLVMVGTLMVAGGAGAARAEDFFDGARRTFQSDIPHFFQDDIPCAFGGKPTSGARTACHSDKPAPRPAGAHAPAGKTVAR